MVQDLITDGASWLARQQRTHCAKLVTYIRDTEEIQIAATVGQSEHRTDDLMGGELTAVTRDFLVSVDDLAINGTKVKPQRGDEIVETIGDWLYTHEVMSVRGPDNAWQYADSARTTYRIHTKTTESTAQ